MSDNFDYKTQQLPPVWENRYEIRGRRQYGIDSHGRMTSLEDARPRYNTIFHQNHRSSPSHSDRQFEMTPLQLHGSPEIRGYNAIYPVYPPYPPPPQPAFQPLTTLYCHPSPNMYHQEMMYNSRPSPILNRGHGTIMGASAYQQRHNHIETSLSANTDELVAKISASFPTASETHIRCLLKKYHNREVVVMSALQVEKHPIATPGPSSTHPSGKNSSLPGNCTPVQMTPSLSVRGTPSMSIRSNMATPPMAVHGGMATPPLVIWGTPPARGSSPVQRPGSGCSYYSSLAVGDHKQSPKSQSSPKMKLRYLKSIFPRVEETVLLEVLSNENNNVMKTSEKLKSMGYEKKSMTTSKAMEKKQSDLSNYGSMRSIIQKEVEIQKPTPPPRLKSLEEKNKMLARLGGLYDEIPERLIQIAIESVDFDEEKARHLLMLMINEEKENKGSSNAKLVTTSDDKKKAGGGDLYNKGSKSDDKKKETDGKKGKPRKDVPKVSRGTSTTEDKEFRSMYGSQSTGRNRDLRKGPNDQLLLADYMTWNGPNPELREHKSSLAEGPNPNLLLESKTTAIGANKSNCKGPNASLVKGSIYSRIMMTLKG